MSQWIREHPFLILFAEHKVRILNNREAVSRRGRISIGEHTKKEIRRVVNLLDVAWKIMAVYIGMGSVTLPTTFVSCYYNTLRCAFVISVMLRELLAVFVDEYDRLVSLGLTGMRGMVRRGQKGLACLILYHQSHNKKIASFQPYCRGRWLNSKRAIHSNQEMSMIIRFYAT